MKLVKSSTKLEKSDVKLDNLLSVKKQRSKTITKTETMHESNQMDLMQQVTDYFFKFPCVYCNAHLMYHDGIIRRNLDSSLRRASVDEIHFFFSRVSHYKYT